MTKQKTHNSVKGKSGFSIVEILVVSGLSVMLMLTISSLFMTFLVGNSTANMRKAVNADGNYAINQISFLLRNAIEINDCATPNKLVLTSIDNQETTFELNAGKIASRSTVHDEGSLFLTSSEVTASDLNFSCSPAGLLTYVDFDFKLTHKGSSSVVENFKTQVLIRN